jgi:hypothetical protein
MTRRLRQYRWSQLRDPQAIRLEGADVPVRHPGERKALLIVGCTEGV